MNTGLYFSINIGELEQAKLDVVSFTLEEALSSLFTLTVQISSVDTDIDLQQQLLQRASFSVYSDGKKQRTVNGIVESAVQGKRGFKRTYYTFVIRPLLWQLTLSQDSRIYHFKSVPDIIDEILRDFNITFDKQLMDVHTVREYTTMKREDYFSFILRLASEEGILFWFEENQLFYSDSHLGMTAGIDLIYNPHPQSATKESVIHQLEFGAFMRPTEIRLKDYRYSHPDVTMDAKNQSNKSLPTFERYDSYGRYYDEKTAQLFSKYRLEALQADSELGTAESNCILLMPGKIFHINEHPSDKLNDRWQIISIHHKGTLPQSLDNESDDSPATLTNQFTFIPGRNDWRPAFSHKPQADGDEIAMVVGPAGEEIYVNEDGAVKIAFHWERYTAKDENASCWVRVVQNWNGGGFGFLATPRIGQEVIVSYLNGDIDRPIITGTVYNGNNRPPVRLPQNKTQMTIKSKTHKGEGFNELRFEDENGKQEVFIHAQKDMNTKVLNDYTMQVHHDSHLQVESEHSETINGNRYQHQKAEEHHLTESDRKTQILANDHKIVGQEEHISIGLVKTTQAGTELHLKSGLQTAIDSGLSLTLKAGGQHIVLSSAGIWASSPILPGGAPMTAKPATPLLPLNIQKAVEPAALPLAQRLALLAGNPRCDICTHGMSPSTTEESTGSPASTSTTTAGDTAPETSSVTVSDQDTVIRISRKWDSKNSTISAFTVEGTQISGYFLERPGPDTTTSGLRLRVPQGTYNVRWHNSAKFGKSPNLFNEQVPYTRYILIHGGNTPAHTDGCLLAGTTSATDSVGASQAKLKELNNYLNTVNIDKVKIVITNDF